jgi:hypothetical protein
MENTRSANVWQAYTPLESQGLSAGLDGLNHLVKYQHSVTFEEGLQTISHLFHLCALFRCRDIIELVELFTIYEFWHRQRTTIYLPADVSPHFEVIGSTVVCTLPAKRDKGCIRCEYFDRCTFPRSITPDDFTNARWRCVSCGNALEFPAIMYETWLARQYKVTANFLCCACFAEFTVAEEFQDDATKAILLQKLISPPPAYVRKTYEYPPVIPAEDVAVYDLGAVLIGLLSILLELFSTPGSHLHGRVRATAPQDVISWEAMRMIEQAFSIDDFPLVANTLLPLVTDVPLFDSLFDYCVGVFTTWDFAPAETQANNRFALSSKFKEFGCVFARTEFPGEIISTLEQFPPAYEKLTLWAEDHFI